MRDGAGNLRDSYIDSLIGGMERELGRMHSSGMSLDSREWGGSVWVSNEERGKHINSNLRHIEIALADHRYKGQEYDHYRISLSELKSKYARYC